MIVNVILQGGFFAIVNVILQGGFLRLFFDHEVVESGLYAVIVCIRYVWYDEMYLVVFVLSLGTIVYADLWMRSGNYKEKTEVIQ